jgi:hypothetical protein
MKRTGVFAVAAALGLLTALPAEAQPVSRDRTSQSFQVRLGGFFPDGGGGLWADVEDQFTLSVSDFNDAVLGFSYVTAMSNHLEIGLNLDFYDNTQRSAERDYVDQDGRLILHDTTLSMIPATVDFRFLPAGRYKARGARGQMSVRQPVPYVGAGVGLNFWEYEEIGDFVHPGTLEIFFDRYKESGTAFYAHVLAGVELPMAARASLLLEGRYAWSDDTLSGDLSTLGKLVMDGPSAYVGLSFHW